MTPAPRQDVPAFIQARVPLALYELVDAYADHLEVTLSEALRRLLVQALDAQGATTKEDRGHGLREDRSWAHPLEDHDATPPSS